ncbi:MAG TPA: thioredoxin family protein, partial [Polyangiaceae bacterium]|nr:thioredoxin family protein [Polyangiaceae bacterium]
MRFFLSLAVALAALVHVGPAAAADPVLSVQASVEPGRLGTGERGLLRVEVKVPAGWHLWSMDPGPGPQALRIELQPGAGLALAERWHGPRPELKFDRGFGRELARYEAPGARFERPVQAAAVSPSSVIVRGQICTEQQCIQQKVVAPVAVELLATAQNLPAPDLAGEPLVAAEGTAAAGAAAAGALAADTGSQPPSLESELAAAKQRGFWSFVTLAFLFGLGALATPCVFPAIPLTVSFFSKFSGESVGRGARLALVYALTMVAAFTFLGVMLSIVFGVTGVQRFAAHPLFNLVLAAVLGFFSLNLLGLFEIQAPQFLLGAANRLESNLGDAARGGSGSRRGLADYVAVGVAAITSTTVFFTCTVAFVGLVLVAAASGEWFWPTVGMLAFSSAFAFPFFLLAMFPQAAKRLQGKAGGWLTATRVTLGFLELAAATKFLSNADLVWAWGLVTRQAVLAVWVPLFVLCGLFLLGKLRLGHESTARSDGSTGVLQMLAAVAMFALALHLGVGLFQNKPFGGWLDGWLPPVQAAAASGGEQSPALAWVHSLEEGRERARRENQLVFVNYTGFTCTNCRYMEGGVFPDPRVRPLLEQMVLVELYTDGGKPEHDRNRDDQVARFGTAALPLYSVEDAGGRVIASFPSSTNDVDEFRRFLEGALARAGSPAVAHPAAAGAPKPSSAVVLQATRLADGSPAVAVVDGQWSLVNFWATWCSPCREELESFLAATGAKLASQGGAFRTVAVESDEKVAEAKAYMAGLGVPPDAALRIAADSGEGAVDPKLEWDETLPFTFLVSPRGDIVWRHTG